MKTIQITVFLCMLVSMVSAQTRQSFEWETKPKVTQIKDKNYLKESAVIIFDKEKHEYIQDFNGNLQLKKIYHKKIHLIDDKGIESFNKLKLPFTKEFPIKKLKARTILKNGKIVNIQNKDLSESTEDNNILLKLLAFEGVEKGCDIEYYYEWQFPPQPNGIAYFNAGVPILNSYFEIEYPISMSLDLKTYNNLEAYEDTTEIGKNVVFAEQSNTESITEQMFSFPKKYLPRLEYVIQNQFDQNQNNLQSWNSILKEKFFTSLAITSSDSKVIKGILKNKEFENLSTEKEKLFWIENYIKSNYTYEDNFKVEYKNLTEVVNSKKGFEKDITRLTANLLHYANINFKVGYTTDKFDKEFDYDFCNAANLVYTFFYLPTENMYFFPGLVTNRMPEIPIVFQGNSALLMTINKNNDQSESVKLSSKKIILPVINYEKNTHDHFVTVNVDDQFEKTNIHVKQVYNGFLCASIRPLYNFIDEEKKIELTKDLLKSTIETNPITNVSWKNVSWSDINQQKDFGIQGDVVSTTSIENAGGNYLVKIGEVIGQQSQLYDEKLRTMPIDMEGAHSLTRTIHFNIPNGYKISNLKSLVIDKSLVSKSGEELCFFKSNYSLDGQKLEIIIEEKYKVSHYEISEFEGFRNVINAAADFNKVSLMLKKK